MCGILGYYKKGGLSRQDVGSALNALHALRHRGPDGEGAVLVNINSGKLTVLRTDETPQGIQPDLSPDEYTDGDAHLFFGHRRLSIIDLSVQGYQPMRDDQGNLIIFNGELYNYIELREDLRRLGHVFKTQTDTEVVLAAFREWGRNCTHRFNGMWALLVFSMKTGTIWMSNDRFGIKPLYYSQNHESLMVMSEAKVFPLLRNQPPALHHEYLQSFLTYGVLDAEYHTPYKGLHKILPAHNKVINLIDIKDKVNEQYWDVSHRFLTMNMKEAAEKLHELFEDSLRLHLRTDVPWGITLSGGVDSGAIAYTLRDLLQKNGEAPDIHSFSAVFPGKAGDESPFIHKVENDLGLKSHHSRALEHFNFQDFERFAWHQDFPVNSTAMYAGWTVYKMIADSNVKVVLCGQGSDELFAGYHHQFHSYTADLFYIGKFRRFIGNTFSWSRHKGYGVTSVMKNALLTMRSRRAGHKYMYASSFQLQLIQELMSWTLPALLRYEDRNSMAFGIETRVPFLDYRIAEFAMMLRPELKIRGGWQKAVLRESMKNVPDEIRWRRDKKGYTTPQKEWLITHKDAFMGYLDGVKKIGIEFDTDEVSRMIDTDGLYKIPHSRLILLGIWLKVNKLV